jgi:hypothetical protein
VTEPDIELSTFQPFKSRVGVDTVLALRLLKFDPALPVLLKEALRKASEQTGGKNLGGWLAAHRVWFVERSAWPIVRRHLRAHGYKLPDRMRQ